MHPKNIYFVKFALRYIIKNWVLRRNIAYFGNYITLVETIYHDKLFVDTRDLSIAPHVAIDGVWEPDVSTYILKYAKKMNGVERLNFIDIGANFGWYSVLVGKRIAGTIYAFEPNPSSFKFLFRNIEINGLLKRTFPEKKAVLDKTTKTRLKVPTCHFGSASIFVNDFSEYKDGFKEIEVETVSLDDYIEDKTRAYLIKIDAEGAEPLIFKGMEELISSSRNLCIFTEFSPEIMRGYHNIEDFLDFIFSYFEVREL